VSYDVIVIGGGFAGVTAAREAARGGAETVLLEARDRLGGRTWTTDFAGTRVELGGAWVHWKQPHIWAELTRYGIGIEEDRWDHDAVLAGNPPTRRPTEASFATIRELFTRYAGEHRAALPRPYDPLFAPGPLNELDELSMQDRLDQLGLSESDQEWLTGLLYEIAGSPLEEAGISQALRWMALCDWNIDNWYETNRFRPAGGTIGLLQAMLARGGVDVRLASPVTAVKSARSRVEVETGDGQTVDAAVAVVAVPVNLWTSIEFSPPLPNAHAEAARQGMGKPHQDKVWIHARGDIRNVFAQLPAPAPLNFFWTFAQRGETQLIIGINTNPSLDVTDAEQVATTIRDYVPEIDDVIEVRGHAWGPDPYSRGGNTCYRPGQLVRYLTPLQAAWGRVAFATADLASGWVGYMDGAIESGIRAARMCRGVLEGAPGEGEAIA
jgi:monoamine oxidase